MSTSTVTVDADSVPADRLVPIAEAARRTGVTVWTLKRLHNDNPALDQLPAFIIGIRWFVPESWIRLVFASMQPGRKPNFAEVTRAWYTANGNCETAA